MLLFVSRICTIWLQTVTKEIGEMMQKVRKKVHCGIVTGSDLDSVNQQLKGQGKHIRTINSTFIMLCMSRRASLHTTKNYGTERELCRVLRFTVNKLS